MNVGTGAAAAGAATGAATAASAEVIKARLFITRYSELRMPTLTVSSTQLRQAFLVKHGEADLSTHFFDRQYAIMADSGVAGFMASILDQVRHIIGPWKTNSNDCDKYARLAQTLALIAHAKQAKDSVGLAVAVICYLRGGTERHAIVMTVSSPSKGSLRFRFWDGETGAEYQLTQAEKHSIYKALF